MNIPSVTLALGGGGARGAAHLGVIEVLVDEGIKAERIVGVSIGSLIGAMFASNPDIREIQRQVLLYLTSPAFQTHQQVLFGGKSSSDDASRSGGLFGWYSRVKGYLRANRIFHRVITHPSMLPAAVLHDVIDSLIPDIDIADTVIPLSIVAVDLKSGHRIILERGSLRDAVRASSSLPGIFPPVPFKEMLLCDIGVFNSLPTIVARSYQPGFVVGVDVSSEIKPLPRFETALDVLIRIDEIGESMFRRYVRETADLVIKPEVSGVPWFDFSNPADLIQRGRVAARKSLRHFQTQSE